MCKIAPPCGSLQSRNPPVDPPTRMQIHWSLATLMAACFVAGCDSSIRTAKGGSSQGASGEPLTLVEIDPQPGRVEVGPSSEILLRFSEAIDPDSVDDASIVV